MGNNKSLKFHLKFALLFVVCCIFLGISKKAYATSTSFLITCPTGQNVTSGNFGPLAIASCDGGGSASSVPGASGNSTNVSVTCPSNQSITGPATLSGSPAKIGFSCQDNNTPPVLSISSSVTSPNQACTSSSGSPCCDSVGLGIAVGCVSTTNGNPIYDYLRALIQFISGIFGLVAVLMIVIAGFQYMTSGGNPDALKKSKSRLANVIISVVLFALMFGILNYLIPGGVI
ncbi:MAG: pilin [Candidatus Saccharimonadia bacterium]